ncbi:unnamed protein product [Brachionus calyciflorus]|uniref:Uncharacterized protein n=1 Tax=Brachionus calyciflorus TaxID=104777 RepID=A0A814A3I4_9BILA|nr:unnamed protein product [Brachionus calyciflorus]
MRSIDTAVRTFRSNLIDLANSRDHHITEEIIGEVKGILSALDSLKLDNMFVSNSNELRSQIHPEVLENYQAGLLRVISDGDAMLYELKNNLGKNNLNSLQENEVRNLNYAARERLRAFIHSVHPYSNKAYQRLENYANDLGLRNRFKSIRNELENRNEDRLKMWSNWTDKQPIEAPKYNTPNWREHNFGHTHHKTETGRYENKASLTSRNVAGSYYTDTVKYDFPIYKKQETRLRESQIENLPPNSDNTIKSHTSVGYYSPKSHPPKNTYEDDTWKKHAVEAGLVLNFPGPSEHNSRFTPPLKSNYKKFIINPQPDTLRFERPFTSAAPFKTNTEYRHRYNYPDGNQIDKFPWIKQF